jgi:ABC-type transport system substrate-binding protein
MRLCYLSLQSFMDQRFQEVYEADPEGLPTTRWAAAWMVEEYIRGDRLVLVANPDYWELGAGTTLHVAPIYRLDYVYLNHKAKPLDSKEFRLALNYATDREAIFNLVYFGYGDIPNGYWPKMNFHSADVPLIPYDIEKAKELVAQSGYDGSPITLLVTAGNASDKQVATILQQSWGEAGINVELQELDSGTFFDEIVNFDYQAAVSYITSDINDDDELATLEGDYHNNTKPFSQAIRTTRSSTCWRKRAKRPILTNAPSITPRFRRRSTGMATACRSTTSRPSMRIRIT